MLRSIWQNAICGDNPNVFLPPPNTAAGLPRPERHQATGARRANAAVARAPVPAYPGYGTGYSTGFPPLTYGGSLVPQSALAQFLVPGPTGFITANYAATSRRRTTMPSTRRP